MNYSINITPKGITSYPLHKHNEYEIHLYTQGEGVLLSECGDCPFCPGKIIIVPPGIMHGSSSKNGFVNISVGGKFDSHFNFDKPVALFDNPKNEGRQLAKMIYDNRFSNSELLNKLCEAFICFLLLNIDVEQSAYTVVSKIMSEIATSFHDSSFKPSLLLNKSGYSEDYIRACFKSKTGKTPVEFLLEVRIKNACFIMEIYSGSMSLSQISERCGFTDYVYFSKKFKEIIGLSPREYLKSRKLNKI